MWAKRIPNRNAARRLLSLGPESPYPLTRASHDRLRCDLTGAVRDGRRSPDGDQPQTHPGECAPVSQVVQRTPHERGYNPSDQRHNLTLAGTVGLPWSMQLSGILKLISGSPVKVQAGGDLDGDQSPIGDLPDGIPITVGASAWMSHSPPSTLFVPPADLLQSIARCSCSIPTARWICDSRSRCRLGETSASSC
jgi:hypothetical protein